MKVSQHQVITADYPENLTGGFMICGINFGISKEEENQISAGITPTLDVRSFFSDDSVNNTVFRKRVLKWLNSWGIKLESTIDKVGILERSFFQTNWLDTQTKSVTSDGVITRKTLINEAGSFLGLLEDRKPSVIFFFGSSLIEALNDLSIRDRVVSILGERSGNAKIFTADLSGYSGKKFKMYTQKFGETQIISLPHPNTRGVTDNYVQALKPSLHNIHKIIDRTVTSY